MSEGNPLTRSSFKKLQPLPTPASIPLPSKVWSDDDWAVIRAGHCSADMDDKWNAFVEADRLYLHRSWTGIGVYEAQFRRDAEGWRIVEAFVANDAESYRRGTDEYESVLLEALVEGVLLARWDHSYQRRITDLRREPE